MRVAQSSSRSSSTARTSPTATSLVRRRARRQPARHVRCRAREPGHFYTAKYKVDATRSRSRSRSSSRSTRARSSASSRVQRRRQDDGPVPRHEQAAPLLRKRKSVTFTEKKEKDILSQVLGDSGLSIDWKHEKADRIKYKHVYQHNQSDLEFLRTRAARIGAHVWCVDSKVCVKLPDLQNDSGDQARSSMRAGAARPQALLAAVELGAGRQEGHGQGLEPGDQGADHRRPPTRKRASSAARTRRAPPAITATRRRSPSIIRSGARKKRTRSRRRA